MNGAARGSRSDEAARRLFRRRPRRWVQAAASLLVLAFGSTPALAEDDARGTAPQIRLRFHDGGELAGTLERLDADGVRIGQPYDPSERGATGALGTPPRASGSEPGAGETPTRETGARDIALYEIASIEFGAAARAPAKWEHVGQVGGPAIVYRTGEILPGAVLRSDSRSLTVDVEGSRMRVPVDVVAGVRLGAPSRRDDRFRRDLADSLAGDAARSDRVYVLQRGQLVRIEGLFRSLTETHLTIEYRGRSRRIAVRKVFAVMFAPAATREEDLGFPAVFELASGGEFPGVIVAARVADGRHSLAFRFRGAEKRVETLPLDRLRSVRFFSDRVLFLSDAKPVRVEEAGLIGEATAFPWRKDVATDGRPLRLGGRRFRKGLGVHARSALDFRIGASYATFAATIGYVDERKAARRTSAAATQRTDEKPVKRVEFRVVADGKELFRGELTDRDPPREIALPVRDVELLRLEVGYGSDGLDFGDHVAWAEARCIKE